MPGFDGLNAAFTQELQAMMKAAPGNIGVTSGARTHDQQAALYAKDPSIAAKPGASWHEVGLAADLNFADSATLAWAHQHAAEFGLFFPMSWEPWHVQPLWTQGRKVSEGVNASDSFTPAPDGHQSPAGDPLANTLGTFKSMFASPDNANELHPFDDMVSAWGKQTQPNQPAAQSSSVGLGSIAPSATGKLNYQAAYNLAMQAGATPDEARVLAAIAGPESIGYDPHAHNPDATTGDNSYGLWQINMLGQMGVDRAREWGLSSYDDLYDPATNAKAAVSILRSQGFDAWTAYKNGSYRQYLPAGAA